MFIYVLLHVVPFSDDISTFPRLFSMVMLCTVVSLSELVSLYCTGVAFQSCRLLPIFLVVPAVRRGLLRAYYAALLSFILLSLQYFYNET